MKSDYLQRQVDECRVRWRNKYQQELNSLTYRYEGRVQTLQTLENEIQNYVSHYSLFFIIREIVICFIVSLLAAGILGLMLHGIEILAFVATASIYVFFRRHEAGNLARYLVASKPDLQSLAHPNLLDVIRIRNNHVLIINKEKEQLAQEKEDYVRDKEQARISSEQSCNNEIVRKKDTFLRELRLNGSQMQASQYPVQIRLSVMPEVQKMLQSCRKGDTNLRVSISLTEEEIIIQTNNGLEQHFSFSSCGLSNPHSFMQRIALTTITSKQVQLEVTKVMLGAQVGIEQNDTTSTITIRR